MNSIHPGRKITALPLILCVAMSSCSLVEKTPNQSFMNDFIEEVHTDPTAAYDWTSADFQTEIPLDEFLVTAEDYFSNIQSYRSYTQTMRIGYFSVEIGTSSITDYGELTLSDGEIIPAVVYLRSVNGDLRIEGVYTIETLIKDELSQNLESGFTELRTNEISYDSIKRTIMLNVSILTQDGGEEIENVKYIYQGGKEAGWVRVSSDL